MKIKSDYKFTSFSVPFKGLSKSLQVWFPLLLCFASMLSNYYTASFLKFIVGLHTWWQGNVNFQFQCCVALKTMFPS